MTVVFLTWPKGKFSLIMCDEHALIMGINILYCVWGMVSILKPSDIIIVIIILRMSIYIFANFIFAKSLQLRDSQIFLSVKIFYSHTVMYGWPGFSTSSLHMNHYRGLWYSAYTVHNWEVLFYQAETLTACGWRATMIHRCFINFFTAMFVELGVFSCNVCSYIIPAYYRYCKSRTSIPGDPGNHPQ